MHIIMQLLDKCLIFRFPMELHIVFYKKEYGDFKKALNHSDGLAVLAFFYEVKLVKYINFFNIPT